MADKRDYYEVLGLSRDATQSDIKDAFRRFALKYHPDRNKDPGAEERFKEIAEAYAVLSDPKKRAAYDAGGHAGMPGFSPEDLFGDIHFDDLFADMGFEAGGLGVFDRLFRRGTGPRRGRDVRLIAKVPLSKILTGGEEVVSISHEMQCDSCNGSGAAKGTQPRKCGTCGGVGQLVESKKRGNVTMQQIRTCPECRGHKVFIDNPCLACSGKGTVYKEEKLTVKVPRGAEEGMALRIPRHGEPATEPGNPPGDLYVIVRTEDDPRFQRHGANLWRRLPIDIVDAVLGTRVIVGTLDGEVEIDVPPGTQPDSVLRLQNKGLPRFGSDTYGDLFLRVQVHVPETLTPRERQLYQELRQSKPPSSSGPSV